MDPASSGELEIRSVLALNSIRGMGSMRVTRLIQAFGSARSVLSASRTQLVQTGLVNEQGARVIAGAAPVPTEHPAVEYFRRHREGIGVLTVSNPQYPFLLKQISQPPPLLWTRGRPGVGRTPCVALVGSRSATERGRTLAWKWGYDLASAGVTVVSGLAVGIDAAAHQGALDAGGHTVAVMGTGIDRIYPWRNRKLAEEIGRSGTLLTEFEPGQGARPHHFPSRNRIIAGLCHVVVVMEAAEESGALITARMAQDEGREVGIVPGRPGDAKAAGANTAIRNHLGVLVSKPEDILSMLQDIPDQDWNFQGQSSTTPDLRVGGQQEFREASRRRAAIGRGTGPAKIRDQLRMGPESVESLSRQTGIDRQNVEQVLLDWLLEGRVALGRDQRYRWNERRKTAGIRNRKPS